MNRSRTRAARRSSRDGARLKRHALDQPGFAHHARRVLLEALLRRLVDHRADVGREAPDRRSGVPAWRRPASRARAARCRPARTARAAPSSVGRPSGTTTSTSATTCSGSAEESTSMAFWPPVSAISGTIGPSLAASARLIAQAVCVEPVNATPAMPGSATSRAPTAGPPGSRIKASSGTPARCNSATALAAIRGLRRRFGEHRIADRQGRGNLPGEDREREVPGADRDEHAAAVQGKAIALAGRPGQLARRRLGQRLHGVVAQEIHRLAHLGDRIGQGLAGLAHAPGDQLGRVRLVQVGGAAQACDTLVQGRALPGGKAGLRLAHGLCDRRGLGLDHAADGERAIGRIEHRPRLPRPSRSPAAPESPARTLARAVRPDRPAPRDRADRCRGHCAAPGHTVPRAAGSADDAWVPGVTAPAPDPRSGSRAARPDRGCD